MKLTVVLAVLIGILVLACSTGAPAPVEPTPNIDATVEARVAQERAVEATVQVKVPGTSSVSEPQTSSTTEEVCKLTGGETVPSGWTGKDTGDNSCNSCFCTNGVVGCTKMACPAHTDTLVPTVTPTPTPKLTAIPTPTPTPTLLPKPMIVLGVYERDGPQNDKLLNSIAGYIIQYGYGHPVGVGEGDYVYLIQQMQAGNIDILMSVDTKYSGVTAALETAIYAGNVESLGESLEGYWYSNFVVPTYVIEQNPGLRTVYDIADYKHVFNTQFLLNVGNGVNCGFVSSIQKDCNKTGAVIKVCQQHWPCHNQVINQLIAYGLTGDVLLTTQGGSRLAIESGEAWLGYMGSYDLLALDFAIFEEFVRLEEPSAQGCEDPGDGCAYPETSQGGAAVHGELSITAPEVMDFVSNVYLSNALLESLYDKFREYDEASTNASDAPDYHTGIWFLYNHEDVWADWVPQDIAEKVKASLPSLSEVTVLPTPTIVPVQVKPLGS